MEGASSKRKRMERKRQSLISAYFQEEKEDGFQSTRRDSEACAIAAMDPVLPPILLTYTKRRKPRRECLQERGNESESPDSVLSLEVSDTKSRKEHRMVFLDETKELAKRPKRQLYLDLGQGEFSCTTCKVCGIMYAKGEEEDERTHAKFHKRFLQGIRFLGWREERILRTTQDGGRILLVLPSDHPHRLEKVREVAEHLEKHLGLSTGWLLSVQVKTFLFVREKKVLGSVFAEDITSAHQILKASQNNHSDGSLILETTTCKSHDGRVLCGFRAMWVHHDFRRSKIATKLLDTARANWIHGCTIPHHLCAFSQVTEDGKALAQSYCGAGGFLVYK